MMQRFLGRLPKRFQWTIHNTIAHPAMEVLFQLGLKGPSNRVHQLTCPPADETEERAKGLSLVLQMLHDDPSLSDDLAEHLRGPS